MKGVCDTIYDDNFITQERINIYMSESFYAFLTFTK